MEIGITSCFVGKQTPIFSWSGSLPNWKCVQKFPHTSLGYEAKMGWSRLAHSRLGATATDLIKQRRWRMHGMSSKYRPTQPEDFSADGEDLRTSSVDSEGSRLVKKLNETNLHNRFLKRVLFGKEDAMVNFKSELAEMKQDLTSLAEEMAQSEIAESTRKMNDYIQSMRSRLEAVSEKLKGHIKDADAAPKEVTLFWRGMAESVQVMGSFDGWREGEHLSPEYDGSVTKFTASMMLRPGRYEIKFFVDEEWHLSPEYPTVGEGLAKNNLLIVE